MSDPAPVTLLEQPIALVQFYVSLFQACASTVLAILVAMLSKHVQTSLADARIESDKRQNAVKLCETLYNRDFLKEVSAVVWEIFVKWRYWKGLKGDEYRVQVVSGFVNYLSHYKDFNTPESFLDQTGHNLVRFPDHYHPLDYVKDGQAPRYSQRVLSEHQALTAWVEHWGNVNTMIEMGLVDEVTVRKLFKDWYQFWIDLAIEMRHVVKLARDEWVIGKSPEVAQLEPEAQWIVELGNLEMRLYRHPEDRRLTTNPSEYQLLPWYEARRRSRQEEAGRILKELVKLEPGLVGRSAAR